MEIEDIRSIVPYFLPRKKGNIQIRWRFRGKEFAFSTGTKNMRNAKKLGPKILDSWIGLQKDFVPKNLEPIDKQIERYVRLKYENRSTGTRGPVERSLNRLKTLLRMSTISDLSREEFESKLSLLKGDDSPKYWKNNLSNMRKFFRWCVTEGLLQSDPSINVTMPRSSEFKRRSFEDIWSEQEFEDVLEKLSKQDSEYLVVLRFTGIDLADLWELTKLHIKKSPDGLMIVKRRSKAKSHMETIEQPLSSRVRDLIESRLGSEGRLFPNKSNTSASFGAALYKRVQRVRNTLELPHKDLKSLRHTFASYHVERDVPIDVLRKWMGHSPDSRILEGLYVHRKSSARYMD